MRTYTDHCLSAHLGTPLRALCPSFPADAPSTDTYSPMYFFSTALLEAQPTNKKSHNFK